MSTYIHVKSGNFEYMPYTNACEYSAHAKSIKCMHIMSINIFGIRKERNKVGVHN